MDAFLPDVDESGAICCRDLELSSVLGDRILCLWEGKDIMRKVVLLSSCLPKTFDSASKEILMDAADKCVSVEFLLLEQTSSHLSNMQDKINNFVRCISDLDNCSFQSYLPDVKVFHGLVKRWLQDLKDDIEEPLQARFTFKGNLISSVNHICCNLFASVSSIIDGFSPCQTCRCHGIPLGAEVKVRTEGPSCPLSGNVLGTHDVIENSVKIGEKTILFMPSIQSSMKLHQVSLPVDFDIIERTNLGSLCEVFQGLCSALYSLDQGLICSSNCNIGTMRETAFCCYYVLQPSDNGPMLLRRLAASEEILPVSDFGRLTEPTVPQEIEISIKNSLSKIESKDYNPVMHERGFHPSLNLLVKDSLQFGSVSLPPSNATSVVNLDTTLQSKSEMNVIVVDEDEETPISHFNTRENNLTASITEEWEQLIITEEPKKYSPTCTLKSKLDTSVFSSPDFNKQMDVKTSRILERLEVPRKLKANVVSPRMTSIGKPESRGPTKNPLIPFRPNQNADLVLTSSQLMKPNFQRLKRKFK